MAARRPTGASTTPSLGTRLATSWPVPTATGDWLHGLLQRSVAERAIAGPSARAYSWPPGLGAAATGSTALDAERQEGPIGSTAPDTGDEEGPVGAGWASALTSASNTVSDCSDGCGCASCRTVARATGGGRTLARAGDVAGPCDDVEPRPHPPLLQMGSRHSAVREAQRKLNLAKSGDASAPLNPDCIFGPKTDAAVRAFQRAFGGFKEADGRIGPKTWAKLDAVAGPDPTPPVPPPTPPTPVTIASATVKAAPSGAANTRKRVGVGEVVEFTGSAAGTWKASKGTPTTGASSTTFRWTAPATAGDVVISLSSGTQTTTDTVTVVAPASITMRHAGSHTSQIGAGGACMLTEVEFGPTDVCLGAMQWLEVPGPGTAISGFFTKFSAATLHHNPNPDYALVDDDNIMEPGPHNGPNDHCAWHTIPGPYSAGTFTWDIPNRYIVDGERAALGRPFTDTHQIFTMDAAGTLKITKAGAST